MADPKIVEYVQRSLSEGVPVDEIRRALVDQGWADIEIDEALSNAQQDSAAAAQTQEKGQQNGPASIFAFNKVISATDKEYSIFYVYKVILEVAAFSLASLLLILVGLPFYIPVIAIVIMVPIAYLQISKVKRKEKSAI